jgi:hypothetical protein
VIVTAIAIEASPERAPLPVCLWQENPNRLVSLWDMLQNYLPFYEISRDLGEQRQKASLLKGSCYDPDKKNFTGLLESIKLHCMDFGLTHTANLAGRALLRALPQTYEELFRELDVFNDALTGDLEDESIFRIPPERKDYFENTGLFGPAVGTAFPSCERDIRKAGSCYALEQEDACVHHLMLVLERGLNALAVKLQVQCQRSNWQKVIDGIGAKLKSSPPDPQRIFFVEVNAQFGFLKDAYRNHSEHARDDPYDMEKALSILNHVRKFMQELADGGLKE